MSCEDEMKKFIPEAILEEGDPIASFDSSSFMDAIRNGSKNGMHSPMDDDEIGGFRGFESNSEETSVNVINSQIMQDEEDYVVIVMDIREPLTTLKSLLEEKIGSSLGNCNFSLQDSQILDHDKNLVDLCVQGEGIVQINCEIKTSDLGTTINIADVLKPAEEYVEVSRKDDTPFESDVRWVADEDFKRDQLKMGIPSDPSKWSVKHVRHWLMWAVRQFSLSGIKLSEWEMDGAQLFKMTTEEFKTRVPQDTNNSFWVHFELLRNCKIVAVCKKNDFFDSPSKYEETKNRENGETNSEGQYSTVKENVSGTSFHVDDDDDDDNDSEPDPTDTSACNDNNDEFEGGPIQLWQFLLDLLTNRHHRNAIQWLEDEGEFKLVNPELVAHLWGVRKHKPAMNYEKLSRALRYYYDGEMIAKVHGKRFTYKFVCDLKQLIGYSSSELNARVIEAELKDKFISKVEPPDEKAPLFMNDFITILP